MEISETREDTERHATCPYRIFVFYENFQNNLASKKTMSNGIFTMPASENQDEILSTTKGDACSEYSLKHT